MDEAGEPFLYGEDGESFIGNGDILERPDLFYSAGTEALRPRLRATWGIRKLYGLKVRFIQIYEQQILPPSSSGI